MRIKVDLAAPEDFAMLADVHRSEIVTHFEPQSIQVIELFGDAVSAIVCFSDATLITRFGLPGKLGRSWTQGDTVPKF